VLSTRIKELRRKPTYEEIEWSVRNVAIGENTICEA